jgi:hypothetical protein
MNVEGGIRNGEPTIVRLKRGREAIKAGDNEVYLPPTRKPPYKRLVQRTGPSAIKVSNIIPLAQFLSEGDPDPRIQALMTPSAGSRKRRSAR